MKALVIPADNTQPTRYENLEGLEDFQRVVGGWIETVPMEEGNLVPYFNEEGKLNGLPKNDRATKILSGSIMPHDYIAGDCLFIAYNPETGEDEDYPDGALEV